MLPRINDDVNEEWLADKSRYAIDGLKRRRLDKPWVRRDGQLRPASWARGVHRDREQADRRSPATGSAPLRAICATPRACWR